MPFRIIPGRTALVGLAASSAAVLVALLMGMAVTAAAWTAAMALAAILAIALWDSAASLRAWRRSAPTLTRRLPAAPRSHRST
jgi:hypothetical protein